MKTDKIKKVLIAMDYDVTSKKVADEGRNHFIACNFRIARVLLRVELHARVQGGFAGRFEQDHPGIFG